MAVPTAITDLSATLASNSPAGGDTVFPELDNYLRAAFGFIRQGDAKASDVASATTTDIGAAAGRIVDVTGTTTITSLGTVAAGVWRIVRFTGALTLTHNATSLILPSAANITAASGDVACFVSLGSGNWRCVSYTRASGNNVLNASTFGDGTVGAPAITFAADLDTGFYRSGTNTVNVAAGGASVASFAAAVGITPTTTFTVSGGTTITLTPGEGGALTINPLGTGVTGGDINLISGAGSTTGGTVKLQAGAGGRAGVFGARRCDAASVAAEHLDRTSSGLGLFGCAAL